MDVKLFYGGALLFSVLSLVLVVADVSIASSNRTMQSDITKRQATIAEGEALNKLNQGLVQAMAEAAFKNNDTQMRDLLASQGITLSQQAPAAAAEPAKPAAKK